MYLSLSVAGNDSKFFFFFFIFFYKRKYPPLPTPVHLCLGREGMESSRLEVGVERLKQLRMEQIREHQNRPCSRCGKPALSHRSHHYNHNKYPLKKNT
jgi:hypothetical protein